MDWLNIAVPALISGAAGIAGTFVQRWWQFRDRAAELARQRAADAEERRRLSDAACLRALRPTIESLRHQFELISPGVKDGVASTNVFSPASDFYQAAEGFRHTAVGIWLFDESLKSTLSALLDTLREFHRQTMLLGTVKHFGPEGSGGPKEWVKEVVGYSDKQKELLASFLTSYNNFVHAIAQATGFQGVIPD